MKNNGKRIAKYLCFLLLVFAFNMNVDAIKIYYADENGVRMATATAPAGYPNYDEDGIKTYGIRTITKYEKPTHYYACGNGAGQIVNQKKPCSENIDGDNAGYIHQEGDIYTCALTDSDSVIGNKVKEDDINKEICPVYSDWTPTDKVCDLTNEETCQEGPTLYFWYKEVESGILIDFADNQKLYFAIKETLTEEQIEAAEVNFLGNEKTDFKIAFADISKITKLDLGNREISDIKELKHFTGLTKLELDNNSITEVSALSNLINLTYLDLENNNIKDISPLKGLVNLSSLSLMWNRIEKIEPIIGLKKLEELGIGYNKLTDTILIKKIENYDTLYKHYYFNELKKSGMLKNWSELAEEFTYFGSNYGITFKYTQDSLSIIDYGNELIKFERKNNVLKYTSKTFSPYFQNFYMALIGLDYDIDDIENLEKKCESSSNYSLTSPLAEVPEDEKFTKEDVEHFNCYLSKFGDYSKLTVTYDDNGYAKTIDYSFDLRYFFGDSVASNSKTGVSNWLILLGITLMCSAIGFMIVYKHKTGVQL